MSHPSTQKEPLKDRKINETRLLIAKKKVEEEETGDYTKIILQKENCL